MKVENKIKKTKKNLIKYFKMSIRSHQKACFSP